MGNGREDEEFPDEVEDRLINEEYKIWKKNTPFLYGEGFWAQHGAAQLAGYCSVGLTLLCIVAPPLSGL
jgi:hypothetical protein